LKPILALDIGFAHTGWVTFKGGTPIDAGAIHTTKSDKKQKIRASDDHVRRCGEMFTSITDLVARYDIAGLLVELPHSGGKSSTAIAAMARAQAIAACVAEAMELPVEWLQPSAVKRATTGTLTATKEQVQAAVLKRWPSGVLADASKGTKKNWEHIADAAMTYVAAEGSNLVRMLNR